MIGLTSDKQEAKLIPTWHNELKLDINLPAKDLRVAIQTVKDTLKFVNFRQHVTIHVVAPMFTKVLEQVGAF